jgi:hypothetical protein
VGRRKEAAMILESKFFSTRTPGHEKRGRRRVRSILGLAVLGWLVADALLPVTTTEGHPIASQPGEMSRAQEQEAAAALNDLLQAIQRARGTGTLTSLAMVGKYRQLLRNPPLEGEIRIEMLLPDKLLKTETTLPRLRTVVTLQQAISGELAWVDRRVSQTLGDDGAGETTRGAAGLSRPEGIQTRGMRDVVSGTSVNRIELPGAPVGTERTVMGMPIPQPGGPDASRSPGSVRDAALETATQPRTAPPGVDNPDVQAALREQLLHEFASLSYAWLAQSPATFPLQASYGGSQPSDNGTVEAIDLRGPNEFVARLFVDQTTKRPLLLSYREVVPRRIGYVTTARPNAETTPPSSRGGEEELERTVQLYLNDYRAVEGPQKMVLHLPFQMVRAVNGQLVEEWRVEKYRLNPGLKAKTFERAPGPKRRP